MNSIEWLIDKLQQTRSWHRVLDEISQKSTIEIDIIKQAKEMHRIEHGKTWDASLDNLKARGMNEMRAYSDFDNYYSETLKKD